MSISEGQVIEITKEHIDKTTDNGFRIHAVYSALYESIGGDIGLEDISLVPNSDGRITSIYINNVLYIVCDRIQRWIQAYEVPDSRVSPIKIELLVSEDGEFIFIMNYN